MKDIVFNEKPETWSHVSGMKIMMFVTLTLPLILSAGEVRWQKGSNGQWNGDWSDTSHWSTGTLPAQSDCVIFPEVAEGVTITVSNTYSIANMYMMPMAGPAGHRYDFTLVGSGQVNLVGADSSGYASWITEGRSLTLDGVSLVDAGYQDLMVRGRITVKNGALLRNTRIAKMLLRDAEYIVDGGRFEFSEMAYEASADAWSGAPWPMRFILKSGSVSGRYFYGGTQPLSVEVCNGTMEFSELFTLNNAGCELKIAGGSVKALNSFAIAAGASLVLIDGMLQFPSVAAIDAAANLSLTGGILTLGVVTEDPRFNREGDVTLKYDLGTGVYVKSGSVPVVADTIRLQRFETDSDASSVLHGKFRNIIFSATSEPFRFGNGNQRCFYLEGPTAIWSESDQIDTLGSTWYTYLEGDFIVNTCDARDSTIKRHLSLWSSASRFGSASLTVRGGGSLCLLQHGSASTFRFVTVGTGTTLNLANRRAGEWGPTSAERFTLGAQAKVTMEAKYNHIVADVFSIDPTATIEVQVDDGLTCGAFAILQSSKGVTPDATIVDQIVLKGHAEGWSLKSADGQVSLYKAGIVSGSYATEWIGRGIDRKINTAENFVSALPSAEAPFYFGADETQKTAEWSGPIGDGGYTLGGVCFLETAVNTFGYVSGGETGYRYPYMDSYSGVPQKHLDGSIRTPYLYMRTQGHGSLVFEGLTTDWGGDYFYDPAQPAVEWNYWQWRNVGDCRIAKPLFKMRDFAFFPLDPGFGSYSRFTVMGGSVVDIQDLCADLSAGTTGFRVEDGGVLRFTDTLASSRQGSRRYKWTAEPAGQIVNGTMDIRIPFVGGVTQSYGGKGTLKLASTVPSVTPSRVWLMDTLTLELASDWQTVTVATDAPLTLGAIAGSPVVRVSDGWRYGAAMEPSAGDSARAIEIREGATLTVDACNGSAAIAEPVIGAGTFVIDCGTTLSFAGSVTNTVDVLSRSGSVLAVTAATTVGSLTAESGSILRFVPDATLTVCGDLTLAEDAIAFAGASPQRWQTVIICVDGTVSGVPSMGRQLKTRLVTDEQGRQVVQCKGVLGIGVSIR